MRKRLWQLHSWLGLFAGLGLIVIALSGSVLVFHKELARVFVREKTVVEPGAAGRLPMDQLLARAEQAMPEYEIAGWLLRDDGETLADSVYVIRRGTNVWQTTTVDQYTGRLLGPPQDFDETLYGWLIELHYTLLAGDIGLAVAGLLAVALCVLGVSGVILYRNFWRNLFTLRWGRGARILFSDTHKFVGIVSTAFNLLLGFTGAYWNITHTMAHVTGAEQEQAVIDKRLYPDTLSLDAIVADASGRLPGFRPHFISLPTMPEAPAVILWGAVEPRPTLRNAYGTTLSYDPKTGAHQGTDDIREAGLWRRTTDTFESLHFGDFGGLFVKVLWSVLGLSPGVLGVSGFCLWRLRRRATNRKPQVAPVSAAEPVHTP
mgnify:CR=1 FL=1